MIYSILFTLVFLSSSHSLAENHDKTHKSKHECSDCGCSKKSKEKKSCPREGCKHHQEHKDFEKTAMKMFADAPGLTDLQKDQLMDLFRKTKEEAQTIKNQIYEKKTKMFEVTATQKSDSKETLTLKGEIVSLDQKRLEIMFKALDEMQKIVGTGEDKKEIYRKLQDYDTPSHHRAEL